MQQKSLEEVIKSVRVAVVAKACGRTPKAVYKWIERGRLPRTEYTGDTKYAEKIAEASGWKFSESQILSIGKSKAA